MKMSVIVTTYNWPDALDLVLHALVDQLRIHPNVEVIVADDGSKVDTRRVVEKYQALLLGRLHHVWHDDSGYRRGAIVNLAVTRSSGEYLAFLDGDCIVFPDYIEQQLKLMEAGYFVAGNRVLLSEDFSRQILSNPRIVHSIYKWRAFGWLRATLTKKSNKLLHWLRLGNGKWRYRRGMDWKMPKGCNVAVWRSNYILVNGFDEEFSGWGHEDSDLFVRLLHAGIKIKNGRFALPVLHLWHKEASRGQKSSNWERFQSRLNDPKSIRAVSGLTH